MTTRLRSSIAFLLFALMLVAAYRAVRWDSSQDVAHGPDPVPRGEPEADAPGEPGARAPVSLESEIAAQGDPDPRRALEGRVLDAVFGTPVVAWIDPERGETVTSSRVDGRFRLGGDASGSRELVATAEDYADRGVRLDGRDQGEELVIRLEPSRSAAVIVSYEDGADPSRIPVTWRSAEDPEGGRSESWIASAAYRGGDEHRSDTDVEGICRIPLATRALALIADPRSGCTKSVWVQPDQELAVALPARALVLRFVDDATLAPRPGLEVETWSPREDGAMSERLATDSRGEARLLRTTFPVLVRRPESAAWQSELVPRSPGTTRDGMGTYSTMIRIDAAPGGTVEIGVRECATRIRLRDAATRSPIDAAVRLEVRDRSLECGGTRKPKPKCTLATPRCRHGSGPVFRSAAGELELPCHLANVADLIHGTDAKRRLVVVAAGYRPLALEAGAATVDPDGVPALELAAGVQRRLRVQLEDGTPYAGPVVVYSPELDLLAWTGTAPDGMHGPLDWFGGELVVGHGAEIATWPTTLAAGELAGSETVTVILVGERGSILVEGVPERASRVPLVARLGTEPSHCDVVASSRSADSVRFDGLTPGAYLVGPKPWLEVVAMRLPDGFASPGADPGGAARARVEPGKTTSVPWNPAWAAERDYEGRVVVHCAGRVDAFLAPIFDPGPTGEERSILDVQRRSPRIPLGADGRYVIHAGEPLPRCIAICALDEATWNASFGLHVLETILPGESADLQLGSVELAWRGPPRDEPISVSFDVPPDRLRHPVYTLHRTARQRWSVVVPLRIDGIPLHVRELKLEGRSVPIEPVAGQVARVEVDPVAFAGTARVPSIR